MLLQLLFLMPPSYRPQCLQLRKKPLSNLSLLALVCITREAVELLRLPLDLP